MISGTPEEMTSPWRVTPSSKGPGREETPRTVQSRSETSASAPRARSADPMAVSAPRPPVQRRVCGKSQEQYTTPERAMVGQCHVFSTGG